MRILISNDDGIDAPGIKALANALKEMGEVVVCAPATQQSARGSSMTFRDRLKVDEVAFLEGIKAYAVHGTPRDAVNVGLLGILKKDVDLVVTGINEGANLCNDAVCSGTIGAATAAYNVGICAMATSIDYGDEYDYASAGRIVRDLAEWFINQPFCHDFVLNVNIPNGIPIKGTVVADTGGRHNYHGGFEKVVEEDGTYWQAVYPLSGMTIDDLIEDLDHDIYALKKGYVVLNPVSDDLVKKSSIPLLREKWEERK